MYFEKLSTLIDQKTLKKYVRSVIVHTIYGIMDNYRGINTIFYPLLGAQLSSYNFMSYDDNSLTVDNSPHNKKTDSISLIRPINNGNDGFIVNGVGEVVNLIDLYLSTESLVKMCGNISKLDNEYHFDNIKKMCESEEELTKYISFQKNANDLYFKNVFDVVLFLKENGIDFIILEYGTMDLIVQYLDAKIYVRANSNYEENQYFQITRNNEAEYFQTVNELLEPLMKIKMMNENELISKSEIMNENK